jgi:hypothetical protein
MALAAAFIVSSLAAAAEPAAPDNRPAAAEPAAPSSEPQAPSNLEAPGSQVDPHAKQVPPRACAELARSDHGEITFDQVIPSQLKLQFAGASDHAVRKPDGLEVDYESDLRAKRFWYNGKTITIFDAPIR